MPRMADAGTGESRYFDAAATGVVAYLVGYVLTYLLKSGDVSRAIADPQGLIGGVTVAEPAKWQMIAWLYAGMHNVPGVIRLQSGGRSTSQELRWSEAGPVWEAWLLLIPVLLLVFAGFGFADESLDPGADLWEGARSGAGVVLGYFPAALLGAGATQWRASTSGLGGSVEIVIGVRIAEAALIAGIVYPVFFGGLGGLFAARESGGQSTSSPERGPRDRNR
jgi:hypothetical protein